jgi:hypothetical protein
MSYEDERSATISSPSARLFLIDFLPLGLSTPSSSLAECVFHDSMRRTSRFTWVSALCEALIRPRGGLSALCEALFRGASSIRRPRTAIFGQRYSGRQGINASHNADRPPQGRVNASHNADSRIYRVQPRNSSNSAADAKIKGLLDTSRHAQSRTKNRLCPFRDANP